MIKIGLWVAAALLVGVSTHTYAGNPVNCYHMAMNGLLRSKQLADKEAAYNSVMARIKAYSDPVLYKDIHTDDAHDLLIATNAVLDALSPIIGIRMYEKSQGCVPSNQTKQKDALIKLGNDEALMMEQTKSGLIAAGVK